MWINKRLSVEQKAPPNKKLSDKLDFLLGGVFWFSILFRLGFSYFSVCLVTVLKLTFNKIKPTTMCYSKGCFLISYNCIRKLCIYFFNL